MGKVQENWREAIAVPLFKNKLGNYRQVNVTVFGKLLKGILT